MSGPLPSIGAVRTGCLCCPPKAEQACLSWDPAPGFGMVYLKRNGEEILDYMRHYGEEDDDASCMTVQDFEDRAAGDADQDWRFEIHGPLGGVVYQRQGEGCWVAVSRLDGFA